MPEYDFSELILLVGTNPLPNFVVADYFKQHNKKLKNIWLVCSEDVDSIGQKGTNDQAKRLRDLLKERDFESSGISTKFIPLSRVSAAMQIKHDIQERLIKCLPQDSKVHLNYTGGTQAMGIHVYRVIEQDKQRIDSSCFSYLDARSFQLIFDGDESYTGDLREEVSLSLKELITLHGFERKNEDSGIDPINQENLNKFYTVLENGYVKTFIEKPPKPGHWLEWYVFKELEGKFSPLLRDWQIKKPNWPINDFQLDVIILRGYQLIGISVTVSSDKDVCKRKGFEILHRTRQIGGDEAKAVLVTFCPFQEELQKELDIETGSDSKILVIGKPDFLANTAIRNIRNFISK